MKIKNITLQNIGSYQGKNVLDLNLNDSQKNIVLVGGKNGTGKTTIFTAIKAGIYGCKAFGYENINQKYYEEIKNLINTSIIAIPNSIASIEIAILMDDGKDDFIYLIKRCWQIKNTGIKEMCEIRKGENVILGEELQNFVAFLDSSIPVALFNFYFFDGEKIGDYFLSSESNQNFRKAFLTLCGLDSISLMVENFERVYKLSTPSSLCADKYYALKQKLNTLEEKKKQIKLLIKGNDEEMLALSGQKEVLEQSYSLSGGLTINAWKEINKQIIEEEAYREERHKRLRDISLNEIPFIILKNQIQELKNQISVESVINKAAILKSALSDEAILAFISSYYNCDYKKSKTFADALFKMVNPNFNDNHIDLLDLTSEDEHKINALIMLKSSFDKKEITDVYEEIKKSLARTQRARKKLNSSNFEKIDEFMEEMNLISRNLLHNKSELEKNNSLLLSLVQEMEMTSVDLEKAKQEYEKEIRATSINNIAGRALLVYRETEERLIKKYAKKLENKFIDNFGKIINKCDFIDGINVDRNLNVKPYKNTVFTRSAIKQLINNYGIHYLIDTVGVVSEDIINTALATNSKNITLPVIIKSPLSQGEKQVYIMSLYISLLQIANVNVPFVIDTPFARIDSEHRNKIIDVFFKQLKSQVFILSTDQEIVGTFRHQLNEHISNTFLLESSSHGSSKINANKYFGE